ncbi:MAG: hemolysin III family protein [Ancalomicrobiaceae bacterium]|nr:hemolysin III family protein [Ancalomicrobiaceae bacterium]
MTLSKFYVPTFKRLYSPGELLADGVVHIVAIVAGLIAFAVLFSRIAAHGEAGNGVVVAIYAAGFFLMFGFSCAYNLAPPSQLKWLLRRFDHAAIYIMIAGTYTALVSQIDDRFWAVALLAVVWAGAIGGSVMKLFLPGRWNRVSTALYLLLGWVVVVAIRPIVFSLPVTTMILVAIGGLVYSAGIVFYKWESLKFQNAIWHSFVAVAAGCHYAGIAYVVGRAAT